MGLKKTFFVLLILGLGTIQYAHAQRWKSNRTEVIYGLGVTTFLGELGGANYIGTHQFRDVEWRATRPCLHLGYRYRLSEYWAVRPGLYYGYVVGKDKWTKEPHRNYRNLEFGSNVVEFSTVAEWSFMKEIANRKYRLRGVKGKRGTELYTYFFLGVGGFYYNPTAKDANGQRQKLKKLHTEGQSTKKQVLIPARKEYSGFSVCIPMGIGFKYTINKKTSIGIEFCLRYTFTDYMDDVSTTYVDPNLLETQGAKGPKAVEMADRSNNGDPKGEGYWPGFSSPGAERGDPRFTDSYLFSIFSINYKLKTTKGNLPKF